MAGLPLKLLERVSKTARIYSSQRQQVIHRELQNRRIQLDQDAELRRPMRRSEESSEERNESIRATGRSVATEVMAGVWICCPAAGSEYEGEIGEGSKIVEV
jgi:hypothetical protein